MKEAAMREIDFSRLYVTDENYSGKHGQRDVEFLKKIISDKELVYIQFTHCTFVGMDLRDMDLKDLWFQDCMFQDCRFQKSRIEEWYAERTRFRKCSFKDAIIRMSDLERCEFQSCDLSFEEKERYTNNDTISWLQNGKFRDCIITKYTKDMMIDCAIVKNTKIIMIGTEEIKKHKTEKIMEGAER